MSCVLCPRKRDLRLKKGIIVLRSAQPFANAAPCPTQTRRKIQLVYLIASNGIRTACFEQKSFVLLALRHLLFTQDTVKAVYHPLTNVVVCDQYEDVYDQVHNVTTHTVKNQSLGGQLRKHSTSSEQCVFILTIVFSFHTTT